MSINTVNNGRRNPPRQPPATKMQQQDYGRRNDERGGNFRSRPEDYHYEEPREGSGRGRHGRGSPRPPPEHANYGYAYEMRRTPSHHQQQPVRHPQQTRGEGSADPSRYYHQDQWATSANAAPHELVRPIGRHDHRHRGDVPMEVDAPHQSTQTATRRRRSYSRDEGTHRESRRSEDDSREPSSSKAKGKMRATEGESRHQGTGASSTELAQLLRKLEREGIERSLAEPTLRKDEMTQFLMGHLLDTIDSLRNENDILIKSKSRVESQLISTFKKRPAPQQDDLAGGEDYRPRKFIETSTRRREYDSLHSDSDSRERRALPSRASSSSQGARTYQSARPQVERGTYSSTSSANPSPVSAPLSTTSLAPPSTTQSVSSSTNPGTQKTPAKPKGPSTFSVPGTLPPQRIIMTDPRPPTPEAGIQASPASSDDEDDLDSEESSPDEGETNTQRRDRLEKNMKIRRTKESRLKESQRLRRIQEESQSGRVPDVIGVVEVNGQYERDNSFLKMPQRQFYYSHLLNTIFVGHTAHRAAQHEQSTGTPFLDMSRPLLKCVPRGFPMNPRELMHLVMLITNKHEKKEVRAEAWELLTEFRRISSSFTPENRDRAMRMITDYDIIPRNMPIPYHRADSIWDYPPVARVGSPVTGNMANRTGGIGLPQPEHDKSLDIDAWARWLVMHGRPGGDNPYAGIVMNRAFWVDRRSVFGYLLGKVLSPADAKGRAAFMRQYACVVARPHFYHEAVSAWETANSTAQPFIEATGSTITITPLRVDPGQLSNLSADDVVSTLIRHRIPRAWVDHAYTYGLHFLNHHSASGGMHASLIQATDDDRLARLVSHGTPAAIPTWGGWWEPTYDDITRLQGLIHREMTKYSPVISLEDPNWMHIGESPLIPHLYGRPAPPPTNVEPTAALPLSSLSVADPSIVNAIEDQEMVDVPTVSVEPNSSTSSTQGPS